MGDDELLSRARTDRGCRRGMPLNDSLQRDEIKIPPLRMPDLPLPTPPPMANIMMTSRIGYRRILGELRRPLSGGRSHSMEFEAKRRGEFLGKRGCTLEGTDRNARENRANTVEFMSPILARAYLYHREPGHAHQALLTNQLGLSPLPRHKNFENLSERMEDFNDYPSFPHLYNPSSVEDIKLSDQQRSKYFSRDSVLFNELEEVRTLSNELQRKFVDDGAEVNIDRILGESTSETSPEYYTVFMNEHYISDIDENEEIKEFACGHKAPERGYPDQVGKIPGRSPSDYSSYQTATLPSNYRPSTQKKCSKKPNKPDPIHGFPRTRSEHSLPCRTQNPPRKILKNTDISRTSTAFSISSASSTKSCDYYAFVPGNVKRVEFSGDSLGKVIKSPQRTVVKLAKIR